MKLRTGQDIRDWTPREKDVFCLFVFSRFWPLYSHYYLKAFLFFDTNRQTQKQKLKMNQERKKQTEGKKERTQLEENINEFICSLISSAQGTITSRESWWNSCPGVGTSLSIHHGQSGSIAHLWKRSTAHLSSRMVQQLSSLVPN